MKTELTIAQDTFKDEKGVTKPYVSFKFELDGESFQVYPRENDKRLIHHLLKKSGFYDEPTTQNN